MQYQINVIKETTIASFWQSNEKQKHFATEKNDNLILVERINEEIEQINTNTHNTIHKMIEYIRFLSLNNSNRLKILFHREKIKWRIKLDFVENMLNIYRSRYETKKSDQNGNETDCNFFLLVLIVVLNQVVTITKRFL